jgi:hypothetical protein
MHRLLSLIAAMVCLAGLTWAQNPALDGEWKWKMDSPQGEVGGKLVLKIDGEKVTGSFWAGPDRELKIDSGEFKDGKLKLIVKRDRPSGGTMTYNMAGKLADGKIDGEVSAQVDGQTVTAQWSATRP